MYWEPVATDEAVADPGDLTVEHLSDPQCLFLLGTMVGRSLLAMGTATLMVDEEGGIHYVNPLHVFVNSAIAKPPDGKVAKPVRPIILDARPQYVMVKADGTIWEVEFEDKEPT